LSGMKRNFFTKAVVQSVAIFAVMGLFGLNAETIILRSGKAIQGKVLGHDSESVTINVDGTTQTIPKTNVYKVIFSKKKTDINKYAPNAKIDPDLADVEIDESADKKELTSKLTQLEKKIDKLEKKITRLREKITRLRMKIKEKQAEESKGKKS
jgi:chromosome segregation ATPase